MSSIEEILQQWQYFNWDDKCSNVLGKTFQLVDGKIECLKNTRKKTSIWTLSVTDGNEFIPIVLKIFKAPLKENHIVETNMYLKTNIFFREFMPKMYWIETGVNDNEIWLFTEFLEPVRRQIKLIPKHLDQIIPMVAKFHAMTFEKRFCRHSDLFIPWLPQYNSIEMTLERKQHIEKTVEYLNMAMEKPGLREMIEPKYKNLQKILQKGPLFFPEILEAGQCIIHGDLHIHNICGKRAVYQAWDIQLIDWESAKLAPCWYDLVVLVELLIDFRRDWHKKAEEIRGHCAQLYSSEMEKSGIIFKEEPLRLLKMAYLQRALEKRLLNHLRRVLNGEQSVLLTRYLDKIELWGRELGRYE